MKVGATRSQLFDAQKTARAHWDRLSDIWSDAAQREFEENSWVPMDRSVTELLRSVDQLSVIFAQIRHECEFPG